VVALKRGKTQHFAAITDPQEIPALMRAIDGYRGTPVVVAALNLSPLLFVRPGELRNARWEDVDLEAGTWAFQPSKNADPLIVPLPRQAVQILSDLHGLTGPEGYVFPSVRGPSRPISDSTLGAALDVLGYKNRMTAHGFRAMARTILAERLGYPEQYIEQQLAHKVRDSNGRAYNRTKFLDQRREMLQSWADYLEALRDGGGERGAAALRVGCGCCGCCGKPHSSGLHGLRMSWRISCGYYCGRRYEQGTRHPRESSN
jgi:integrase